MRIAPDVAEALAGGRPVVALESTLISHGLPRPRNLEVARQVEEAARADGALAATIAVVAGEARIGLDDEALEVIAAGEDVVKCAVRDLAPLAAFGEPALASVDPMPYLDVQRMFDDEQGSGHRVYAKSVYVDAAPDALIDTTVEEASG